MDRIQSLEGEEWREVQGFPSYQISNFGRVSDLLKKYYLMKNFCIAILLRTPQAAASCKSSECVRQIPEEGGKENV